MGEMMFDEQMKVLRQLRTAKRRLVSCRVCGSPEYDGRCATCDSLGERTRIMTNDWRQHNEEIKIEGRVAKLLRRGVHWMNGCQGCWECIKDYDSNQRRLVRRR